MAEQARMVALLDYNADTGVFLWKQNKKRAKAGDVAGTAHLRGYWQITVDRQPYLAHRLVWLFVYGRLPEAHLDIDHVNGDRRDNRLCNLREVTRSQNMQNQRKARGNSSTGFLGVLKNHKRFASHIRADGVTHYLGTFDTAEEAHAHYLKAKSRLHIQSVAADRGVVLDEVTA